MTKDETRRGRVGRGALAPMRVVVALAAGAAPAAGRQLGPVDGRDLPPSEVERVAVGTVAPDFALATLGGDTLTLSGLRGRKDVILVFYRGWW